MDNDEQHTQDIQAYYDALAQQYDHNRFANSYGQYIDQQERSVLSRILKNTPTSSCLDLGCGTGRLLDFADYGIDFSPEMLKVARAKYPDKQLIESSITNIPLANNSLDAIYSFHVIMHQDLQTTTHFLQETHRVLKTGGKLIFDFPSARRRKQVQHQQQNWHGANQFDLTDIHQLISDTGWTLVEIQGILFFPIHRIPTALRRFLIQLDTVLCQSMFKEYASYLVVVLEKKS